jgi:preprotein translocase subunit SecB
MSDENTPATDSAQGAAAGQQKQPAGLKIRRIYLKDLSFETPMGVEGFSQGGQPKIDQDLSVQVNAIEEGLHEVILLMTITATIEKRVVFLVEVKQAGLFAISGLNGPQLSHVINSHCPQILFPYAREAIDAAVTRGSFPALMLPPLNFDAIFAQAMQQASQKKASENSAKAE